MSKPTSSSVPKPSPLRALLFFGGLAILALAIAITVGWVILQNLPILMAHGLGSSAYFVLLVILALAAAVVLFGVLRATASMTGSYFGYTLELGGPAAVFMLILIYGVAQYPSPTPSDFPITFRFKPTDNRSMADVFGEENVKKAKVILYLPTQTMIHDLGGDGYAKIENIPARYRANPIEFNLSSTIFLIKDRKPTYQIPFGPEPVLTLEVVPAEFGPTKPAEPAVLPKTSRAATINSKVARITSGGTSDGHSPFCQRRSVQQCVTPERGGHLVTGTGSVTNEVRVGRAGWTVVKDTPEQICIEFWAATGACETEVSIQGQATALEEFSTP
jgi:hypothetical protein